MLNTVSSGVHLRVYLFLQIGADAEHEDNISEQKRQLGKKLVYGQIIQVNIDSFISSV